MKRIIPGIMAIMLVFTLIGTAYASFYSIKRTNITTTSVTVSFGFPDAIVMVESDSTNTDDICIHWEGRTVSCPAANTPGGSAYGGKGDVLGPGRSILLDANEGFRTAQVSVIAASGTQTVTIRAWR